MEVVFRVTRRVDAVELRDQHLGLELAFADIIASPISVYM